VVRVVLPHETGDPGSWRKRDGANALEIIRPDLVPTDRLVRCTCSKPPGFIVYRLLRKRLPLLPPARCYHSLGFCGLYGMADGDATIVGTEASAAHVLKQLGIPTVRSSRHRHRRARSPDDDPPGLPGCLRWC
jgi:hypothetical protein